MSVDRARRALELVDGALAIDAADRAAWLHEACDGDTALEKEVAELLELESDAPEFLTVDDARGSSTPPAVPFVWPVTPTARELASGTRLGDFLIEKQIGAGGMGVVYRALQISLNRAVAIKVLPSHLRHSASANLRFRREVEAAARLHHSNIVPVHTIGEQCDTLYYAMELIEGPPLSQVLDHLRSNPIPELRSSTQHGPTELNSSSLAESTPTWAIESLVGSRRTPESPIATGSPNAIEGAAGGGYFDRVAAALAGVADALGYAHTHDVIHRDVKPSNLLLSSEGRLHISDFGLARLLQEPALTRTGDFVGTLLYMAPEQLASGRDLVDGRADIYALGATLYELLTLRPPFVGENREHMIAQIASSKPVPPRRLNKPVPRDLETICLKALEKSPADRYQTAKQMGDDLRAYVHRFAISARRAGPVVRTIKWTRRHPGLTAALATASLLAMVALFFAFRAHQSQSRWSAAQQEQVFGTALLAALEGKSYDAQSAVEEAERLGAPPGRMHLLEGQVDLIAARYIQAHQHFEEAANQMPENVAAQSLLALACMRRQLYDQGEAVYLRVRSLSPITLDDYLHKARVEAYFDTATAVDTLDAAIERDKSSLVARLIRAEVQTGLAMDTANPDIAEAALADYDLASELLGESPLVAGGRMIALLAAATAYGSRGQDEQRDKQLHRAAALAIVLGKLDVFRAQRARAFYFDYIGDVDNAITEWRKFQYRQNVFQVLTLYREGRFDEALEAYRHVQRGSRNERMFDFFEALIVATRDDDPEALSASFPLRGQTKLDPIHELLTVYTVSCLAGRPEVARREAARLRHSQQLPSFRNNWYRRLSACAAGEIVADDLLQHAIASRKNQCEGHYYVGIMKLSQGNRVAAKEHFRRSADSRMFNYFEYFLSRALLAHLERDPQWPEWILPP